MSEIFLNEDSKTNSLMIMQINLKDGESCNIYVGEFDNPSDLAEEFIGMYNLPRSLLERIAGQIGQRRDLALQARDEADASDSQTDASNSFESQQPLKPKFSSSSYVNATTANVELNAVGDYTRLRTNTLTAYGRQAARSLSEERRRPPSENSSSSINMRAASPPYFNEGSWKPLKNQLFFDRMYR